MSRNRSLALKLRHRQRRGAPEGTSATPRTDNFITLLPAVHLPASLPSQDALFIGEQVRSMMLHWSEFARELERELMQSTPREWKK
jgi:hypothetical protein